MGFQSAPECAEAVIRFTVNSQIWKNVLNFRHTGGYGTEQIADLATVVSTWVGAQMKVQLPSSAVYLDTLVRGLEFENDITYLSTAGTGVGGNNSAAQPLNCAICITHRSALTGRSARGRTYWAPIPESALGSVVTVIDAYAVALADGFNALRPIVEAEGWRFVILSRYANKAKRLEAVTFDVISSVRRDTLIDSQRGRLANN